MGLIADDITVAYGKTERLIAAYGAPDGPDPEAVRDVMTDVCEHGLGKTMLAWAQTIAAAHTGPEALALVHLDDQSPCGRHLAALIDASSAGRLAAAKAISGQLADLSDTHLWEVAGRLGEAVWRWTRTIGGLEHWRNLVADHETVAAATTTDQNVAAPAAAVIALLAAGQRDPAHARGQ